ncbi:MAG: transglutaminase family protein [Bacteroidota bacterium]
MPSPKDIPHLIALLEDDSEMVRENVISALMSFGAELERAAFPYNGNMNPSQIKALEELYRVLRLREFESTWLNWLDMEEGPKALEFAFSRLAYLNYGYSQPLLEELLDELTDKFYQNAHNREVDDLMSFLFNFEGFAAPKADYYNPLNSNLVYVINHHEGIQISLSCLAILLGNRVGIELFGVNIPGHFMTISFSNDQVRIYDCFNKGRPLPNETVSYLVRSMRIDSQSIETLKAKNHEILQRVLQNILYAHARNNNQREMEYYQVLVERLQGELKSRGLR